MTKASFQTASDVFDSWRNDVLTGQPPVLYPVGAGELSRIEIGPKLVTLFGGAPGAGKTAFTMQCVVDGLRLNDSLRALVCNIEMPASVLLDRQLARLSGIKASDIRYRNLTAAHAEPIDLALNTLEEIADRLCFVQPPFDLANVAASADAFDANLIVLDYIQRIPPPGQQSDRRGSVDATMNYLRQFADAGVAVVVVAAVSRQKDSKGSSSYAGLSLASFRESSELEFGADDAYILSPDPKKAGIVHLRHLKARHTEPHDIELRFHGAQQSFVPCKDTSDAGDPIGKLPTALSTLWDQTKPANEQ